MACISVRRSSHKPQHRGENVDIYIVDSGVNKLPAFFGRRVRWKENYTSQDWTDARDHGTRMASLIGSNRFGLSTRSKLYVYKVDVTLGRPAIDHIINAFRAIAVRHERRKRKSRRYKGAVINLSLFVESGTHNQAMRSALELMDSKGIIIVAAAGNGRRDLNEFASGRSSIWSEQLISVGAVDKDFRLAEYDDEQGSNWWQHLTIFAPGKDLVGVDASGTVVSNLEGTSAACAYVTGMVAVLLSGETTGCSATQVKNLLVLNAHNGIIPCLPRRKGPNLVADRTFPKAQDDPWLGYRRSDAEIDEILHKQASRTSEALKDTRDAVT